MRKYRIFRILIIVLFFLSIKISPVQAQYERVAHLGAQTATILITNQHTWVFEGLAGNFYSFEVNWADLSIILVTVDGNEGSRHSFRSIDPELKVLHIKTSQTVKILINFNPPNRDDGSQNVQYQLVIKSKTVTHLQDELNGLHLNEEDWALYTIPVTKESNNHLEVTSELPISEFNVNVLIFDNFQVIANTNIEDDYPKTVNFEPSEDIVYIIVYSTVGEGDYLITVEDVIFDILLYVIVTIIFGAIGAGVVVYRGNFNRHESRLNFLRSRYGTSSLKELRNQWQIENIAKELDISLVGLVPLLNSYPEGDENYLGELKNTMPLDLVNFKYLLNPIRLMILKILDGEFRMNTTDLTSVLEISSAEFNGHKKSLLENGYIQEAKQFSVKGKMVHYVYLTKQGKSTYQGLLMLLSDLIQEPTPYLYLIKAKSVLDGSDNLYPQNQDNDVPD